MMTFWRRWIWGLILRFRGMGAGGRRGSLGRSGLEQGGMDMG